MTQKKFVGLDVHRDTIAIVVIDEQGNSLIQSVVATEVEVIRDFLIGLSGKVYVTFEVGTQSNWLYHQINPIVHKVVVCNPRHNKFLMVGNKADLIDAEKLAQLLRLDSLKEVWQHSAAQLHLKELVRTHENLVSDCVRVKNRIKAIYRSHGIKCSGTSVYGPGKREMWLTKLGTPGMGFRADTLLTELDTLTKLRKQTKLEMFRKARKHADYKRLCQIPGLGFISVSYLLAQVGTPFRFKSKRQFWKYCGFAVNTHSSADHQIVDGKLQKRIKQTSTRGLTRHYCHRLKAVFKSAAQTSSSREPFCFYYENLIAKGTRPALAQVALARKIAATTLSIWKNQSDFDGKRVAAQGIKYKQLVETQ